MFIQILQTVLILLMLFVLVFIAILTIRSKLRRKPSKDLVKVIQVLGDRVVFGDQLKLVRGAVGITAIKGSGLNAILRTKYRVLGRVEERSWISLTDICTTPPILRILYGKQVNAELPAFIAVNGKYKGVIVACIDTTSLHARGDIEALGKYGYFRGVARVDRGILKAKLEWTFTPHTPSGRVEKLGKVALELCAEGFYVKGCTEVLELGEPGITEKEYKYPTLKKIVVGDITGEGLEEIAELADIPIGLLGVGGVRLRLTYKSRLRKRVIKSVQFM